MSVELIALPAILVPDDGRWRDHARCKKMGNEMFFDYGKKRGALATAEAKEIAEFCAGCPVNKECLDFALNNNIKHGIWGGMTPNQRKSFCNGSEQAE